MHWTREILALKAQGRTIQIFDLPGKQKLKSTVMNEDVVFWKWFSETSLGLVTETSVYHWNVFEPTQDAPVKMFERHQNLAGCQIINYRVNDDEKWMVVVGISQKEGRVAGTMQLYSKERGISQQIEGHAAAFATFQADGQPTPYNLFTFAVEQQPRPSCTLSRSIPIPTTSALPRRRSMSTSHKRLPTTFQWQCKSLQSTASST